MTKKLVLGSVVLKTFLLLSCITVFVFMLASPAPLQAVEETEIVAEKTGAIPGGSGMRYIAAAVAVGVGSIAGGVAVAVVGSAAMGAVAERPELMGRSLIYVGLAEGIAIYGMVIAIMILMQ